MEMSIGGVSEFLQVLYTKPLDRPVTILHESWIYFFDYAFCGRSAPRGTVGWSDSIHVPIAYQYKSRMYRAPFGCNVPYKFWPGVLSPTFGGMGGRRGGGLEMGPW